MSQQRHLHAQIGDAISGCKKKLFFRLKDGADLATAVAQFFCELSAAFDRIIASVNGPTPPKGDRP